MAKVTILIPSYNPGTFLREALDSVMEQSYSDWKLIIIDDHSTDQSIEYVSDLLRDSRISVIQTEKNLGQSKALNIGLSHVDTPYLLQLDADDWLEPNTLELMVNEMEKQPKNVAVLGANMRIIYENDNKKRIRTVERKGRLFKDKFDFVLANTSVWPRFYRTEALKEIGGWPVDDPYEGRYTEDINILLRLIEKYKFHWIDYFLYNHRQHSSNITFKRKEFAEVLEFSIRNALKRWGNQYIPLFKKDHEGWKIVKRLILNPELEAEKVTVLIPSYNSGAYLKDAVQSVFKQSYTKWRLIIIDDASTDSSSKLIRKELKDPRVQLIKNEKNMGQAKSLNIGLERVETPYVIQLDADDWLEDHTLERMVEVMDKLPSDIAVLSGNMKMVYERNQKVIRTRIRKGRLFKNKYSFLLSNASVWPRFYRTEALISVDGWPTNGPFEGRYIEDLRILFRLLEKYRFYWVDEVLYNHRRHKTNQTKEIYPMVATLEWLIHHTLVRWGNQYKPVFITTKKGYKKVVKLIPIKTKMKSSNTYSSTSALDKQEKYPVRSKQIDTKHNSKSKGSTFIYNKQVAQYQKEKQTRKGQNKGPAQSKGMNKLNHKMLGKSYSNKVLLNRLLQKGWSRNSTKK